MYLYNFVCVCMRLEGYNWNMQLLTKKLPNMKAGGAMFILLNKDSAKNFKKSLSMLLGPICYKVITIFNYYAESGLSCFLFIDPKALFLFIFIV